MEKTLLDPTYKKYYYLFLFILPFLLYANAFDNEYSIDDNIVVDGIEKLEPGLSSIPEIFTSFYAVEQSQKYGYRPVVSSTFALEKQFFSGLPATQTSLEKERGNVITQANISHFINVLIYALTGILMFYLLGYFFPEQSYVIAFAISLLFILLPIHTEPVNNIKSRDELLMFFGFLMALLFYIKYAHSGKWYYIIFALFWVAFAVLSKKSAVALIGVLPVTLYYMRIKGKRIAITAASLIGVFALVVILKNSLLPEASVRELKFFENPLYHEGGLLDRVATGFYCAFFYLKMLVYPQNFSFYYGYSKIPIITWANLQVWLGVIIFIPLGIYGIMHWFKRDALGLGIVLWLGTMLGVLNVFTPVVGVVADRFAYLFSFGFCITIGVLLFRIFNLEKATNTLTKKQLLPLATVLGFIGVIYAGKILYRNPDWENYKVLYRTDLPHLRNSAKANVMLADVLAPEIKNAKNDHIKAKLVKESVDCYEQAIQIDPGYDAALNNLAYLKIRYLKDYEGAISLLKRIKHQKIDLTARNLAMAYYRSQQYDQAIPYLVQTISNYPSDVVFYENLLEIARQPQYQFEIEKKLLGLNPKLGNTSSTYNVKMGQFYARIGDRSTSLEYSKKALQLEPDNVNIQRLVQNLEGQ